MTFWNRGKPGNLVRGMMLLLCLLILSAGVFPVRSFAADSETELVRVVGISPLYNVRGRPAQPFGFAFRPLPCPTDFPTDRKSAVFRFLKYVFGFPGDFPVGRSPFVYIS